MTSLLKPLESTPAQVSGWPRLVLKHHGAVAALIVLCLATVYVVGLIRPDPGDIALYYRYSTNVLSGLSPYRDFPVEYPPGAFLSFLMPFALATSRTLSFDQYSYFFLSANAALSVATLMVLLSLRRKGVAEGGAFPAVRIVGARYLVLTGLIGMTLAWRFDLMPTLLVVLALAAILSNRPVWGGLILGLAIAVKLYAFVLIPIVCCYYIAGCNSRQLPRVFAAMVVSLCLGFLPLAGMTQHDALSFLRYHAERGIQLESVASSVILMCKACGLTKATIIYDYGAYHLITPVSRVVLKILPCAFIVMMGLVTRICLREFRIEYARSGSISAMSVCRFATISLLVFIVTNKVFSPQYLIWVMPLLTLVRGRQFALCIVVFALTVLIFPLCYGDLLAMKPYAIHMLALRNACVIAVLLWLIAGDATSVPVIGRLPELAPERQMGGSA